MEFSLRPDEALPSGLRRVAVGQLEVAAEALHARQTDFDTGVHEARKAFKRLRAVLRLLRGELGPATAAAENRCYRDAGRSLAATRDAFVLRLTLGSLAEEAPEPGTAAYLSGLAGRVSTDVDAAQLWRSEVIPHLQDALAGARLRVNDWPLQNDRFEAIGPELERTYRQGQSRMWKAFESNGDRAYHSWRRRAKELWYQLQLLEPIRPLEIGPLVSDLDALGEALGTDHDLVVARQTVVRDDPGLSGAHCVPALRLIEQRTVVLRDRARALGSEIYRAESDAFVTRIESYWRSGRFDPDGNGGEAEPELVEVRG